MKIDKEKRKRQQEEWLATFTLTPEQKQKLLSNKLARMETYRRTDIKLERKKNLA